MAAKQELLTDEGLHNLEQELEFLKTERRKEIAEKIKVALSFGDLSENSEYDEAKNEQGEIESKIAQLEAMLANAVVLDDKDVNTDHVNVGNRVKIYDFEHDKEYEYRIVGVTEADPFENKISDDSPIGKALLGSRRGDTVTVEAPKGIIKFNIVEISR